jgi:hypothetical protein
LAKALILAIFLLPVSALQALAWSGVCIDTALRINAAERLPKDMLASIAITESGRTDPDSKAKVAWPWTVTSGGEGQYFPTKAAAVAEVRRLRAKGVENIDVGCMQINLKYHPDAFASLAEAFDPETNVRYAARYLKDLRQAWNGWSEAVRHYHSADAERGLAYEKRVGLNLRDLRADPPSPAAPRIAVRKPEIRPVRVAENPEAKAHRAEARAEADAWRQKKLVEYQARKSALRDG